MVKNDDVLHPIFPPKYDIAFVAYKCDKQMLYELEPWCDKIYLDLRNSEIIGQYIKEEQPNTQFNLEEKIKLYGHNKISELHDICVEFDCNQLNNENFQVLVNLSEMLQDSGEIGEMEFDIFKFYIKSLETYEKNLVVCKTN